MVLPGARVAMDHLKDNWDMAVLKCCHMLVVFHSTEWVLVCHRAKITMGFLMRNQVLELIKGKLL